MQLIFRGHEMVRVMRVSEDEIRRNCPVGERRSCFKHNGDWEIGGDVLTVTFRPTIYINQRLDDRTSRQVETHERRHFQDFRQLARRLERSLRQALREGRDPELEARWDWFNYDVCTAAARYHRSIPDWSIIPCFSPTVSRPR